MSGHYFHTSDVTEYAALSGVVAFLTNVVGWSILEIVSDTGTLLDVTLRSTGEPEVPNGFPRIIRFQTSTNYIQFFTYETYVSSTINTGEVSDVTYGKIYIASGGAGFQLMVVADLERVILVSEHTNFTNRYTGYVGRIHSYHRAQDHNYPNLVKGGTLSSYDWYYTSAERNSWMVAPDFTQRHYYSSEPLNITGLDTGMSSDRNGTVTLAAPVLIGANATPEFSELVGEPRGVFRISSEVSQHNSFISFDGKVYVVVVQNSKHMALGPIGDSVPTLT